MRCIGIRLLAWKTWWLRMLAVGCLILSPALGQVSVPGPTLHPRHFIAHRGAHLRSTLAGENSLQAIRYARRAGFTAVETDVRLTADGHLIIMHDETLNRTCLSADGTKLKDSVPVALVPFAELRTKYVLKADARRNRVPIPTLREYLEECSKQGLLPFIEPKLYDASGNHYRDIIRVADEILGPGNYVITSNNKANRVIRDIGLKEVRLMGILYQTTFEEIAGLGNTIMAISTSRFTAAAFGSHAARAVAAGIPIESHADDYPRFAIIDRHPVNYVSTDLLAPDLPPEARILRRCLRIDDFSLDGQVRDGGWSLPEHATVRTRVALPEVSFGGIYLDMEIRGEATVRLANQEFVLKSPRMERCRHQLMVYQTAPAFEIIATQPCEIRSIRLTLAAF